MKKKTAAYLFSHDDAELVIRATNQSQAFKQFHIYAKSQGLESHHEAEFTCRRLPSVKGAR